MSELHPVVAVTGSSGAGTSTVKTAFEHIFRRLELTAAVIEGDSFHRYDRAAMRRAVQQAEERGTQISHFGPEANLLKELEQLFQYYGETGGGQRRFYIHDVEEGHKFGQEPGTFTPWEEVPKDTDLLFYEGLHGAMVNPDVDIAAHADLKIGVVPVVNQAQGMSDVLALSLFGIRRERDSRSSEAALRQIIQHIAPRRMLRQETGEVGLGFHCFLNAGSDGGFSHEYRTHQKTVAKHKVEIV